MMIGAEATEAMIPLGCYRFRELSSPGAADSFDAVEPFSTPPPDEVRTR